MSIQLNLLFLTYIFICIHKSSLIYNIIHYKIIIKDIINLIGIIDMEEKQQNNPEQK